MTDIQNEPFNMYTPEVQALARRFTWLWWANGMNEDEEKVGKRNSAAEKAESATEFINESWPYFWREAAECFTASFHYRWSPINVPPGYPRADKKVDLWVDDPQSSEGYRVTDCWWSEDAQAFVRGPDEAPINGTVTHWMSPPAEPQKIPSWMLVE